MNAVDLHLHTSCSDSSLTVQEVLSCVSKQGLKACSITDHDTFAAYAQLDPAKLSTRIIKGIEVSAFDSLSKQPVHILGYGFQDATPQLDALCAITLQHLQEKSLWQLSQLQAAGYPITLDEVFVKAADSTAIYKQHLMAVLMDHGVCHELYGKLYQTLFKHGGICERAMEYPEIDEVIQAIHQDQGIAVLAHPFLSHMQDHLERIYAMGINGIEVYHSSHHEEETAFLHAFAKQKRLLETGGSDHHGSYGNEPMVGEANAYWQGEEECLCRIYAGK